MSADTHTRQAPQSPPLSRSVTVDLVSQIRDIVSAELCELGLGRGSRSRSSWRCHSSSSSPLHSSRRPSVGRMERPPTGTGEGGGVGGNVVSPRQVAYLFSYFRREILCISWLRRTYLFYWSCRGVRFCGVCHKFAAVYRVCS